jgi:hypothetical protein
MHRVHGGWRSSRRLAARKATSQPGRYATSETTRTAGTMPTAEASSSTHGSDNQMETPSQPRATVCASASFHVTETYSRRRAAGCGGTASGVVPGAGAER